ncbi:DNA polymerase III subunit tau [Legionella geestiana]|uniref:DNA polymerase III subunit gamma/tau n=1 Tax=Legionella geestiana TaxID=45065 RepID=A0A0W0TUZ6_9GAMM|nr:DNA polymerase III subunit gamma/tau [Legionella geestiana]KTC99310.1 DNA polymerase III subunit tau [Legionella geestiana]QBS11976.1 DNA polymerase III subunit gamma/tau [Legionella geestiana]STX53310.1 DNA polymerase III, gamma and tau subunits [Legionella geestiana]
MTRCALARKWRPRTFRELLGQDSLTRALEHSLSANRLHHAYLFTGTRGVGKTSVARLLAKALNCEKGITSEPCLTCDSCLSIEQGTFVDLVEIDGASRTRVEDTREILENIAYAPVAGRFRIYLIDEVHMLSQHSFNALLKTLEEPPAHVKFFLATTDPQKIPQTVLSRCLQFVLRPIDADCIAGHMRHVLTEECIDFEEAGVTLLARAARGSMRDGLSLLDQAIATGGGRVMETCIREMLGITRENHAISILRALAAGDALALLQEGRAIATGGGHFQHVLEELLHALHQMAVCQALDNQDPFGETASEILELAKRFTPEDTQLCYQMALRAVEDIHLAPTLAAGFDMLVLRMLLFKPAPVVNLPVTGAMASEPAPKVHETVEPAAAVVDAPKAAPVATPTLTAPAVASADETEWQTLLSALKLSGLALTAAENAAFGGKSGSSVRLLVANGHHSLFTPAVRKRIADAMSLYFGETLSLLVEIGETADASPAKLREKRQEHRAESAVVALENDPLFQKIRTEFSAEVVKNSITACEDHL